MKSQDISNLLCYGTVAYLGVGIVYWAGRDLYNYIKSKTNKTNKTKKEKSYNPLERKL